MALSLSQSKAVQLSEFMLRYTVKYISKRFWKQVVPHTLLHRVFVKSEFSKVVAHLSGWLVAEGRRKIKILNYFLLGKLYQKSSTASSKLQGY